MKLQQIKRELTMALATCIAFVWAAGGLTAMLWIKGEAEQDALLAERDEWAVYRGSMEGMEKITLSREEMLKGTLLLVSPDHPLPMDYPTPNIRSVRAVVGRYLPVWEDTALQEEAIYSLCDMKLARSLDSGITFTSGALSSAQLVNIRRETFDRYSRVYPVEEAMQKAIRDVPGAGESEHQMGFSVDVELHPPLALGKKDPLMQNEIGCWLQENMWKFGWIDRTGAENCVCENPHIRYVGRVHAAAMHALDMGLESYWDFLRVEGDVLIYKGDQPYAWLHCAPWEEEMEIMAPEGAQYQCSADNTGWWVVAVALEEIF